MITFHGSCASKRPGGVSVFTRLLKSNNLPIGAGMENDPPNPCTSPILGLNKWRGLGQRGTGEIREKVKEVETGIGIADARGLNSQSSEGVGVAKK